MATIFHRVANAYLSSRGHPDTISANWQFIGRTQAGPAILKVLDIKPGRSMSVLHVSLHQGHLLDQAPWTSASSSPEVVAYITNGRLSAQSGVTLATGWAIPHQPPPADLAKLPAGTDLRWELMNSPLMKSVPMLYNVEFYKPRAGHPLPATLDLWVRLATGERFTAADLGYVADTVPCLLVEEYRPQDRHDPVPQGGISYDQKFWYPTLTISIDVKRDLDQDGGEEWLRLRTEAKLIMEGRFDAEMTVFDAQGRLVMISHQVAMAVDPAKNFSERTKMGKI